MDGNGDELDGMSVRLLWEAYGPRDVFEALLRTMERGSFGDCFWKRFGVWWRSIELGSRAVLSFRVGFFLGETRGLSFGGNGRKIWEKGPVAERVRLDASLFPLRLVVLADLLLHMSYRRERQ